jgi:hypothetical protein
MQQHTQHATTGDCISLVVCYRTICRLGASFRQHDSVLQFIVCRLSLLTFRTLDQRVSVSARNKSWLFYRRYRHHFRVGISSLTLVNCRETLSWPRRLSMDIYIRQLALHKYKQLIVKRSVIAEIQDTTTFRGPQRRLTAIDQGIGSRLYHCTTVVESVGMTRDTDAESSSSDCNLLYRSHKGYDSK